MANGPTLWNKLVADVKNMWPGHRNDICVAGGAIRDFVLGMQPNDIDIFLSNAQALANQPYAPAPGWEFRRELGREEYPGADQRFNVFEYLVDGDTIVQVMFLRHNFMTHYGGFDNNLTKGIYWPQDVFNEAKLVIDKPLLDGIEQQIIYSLVHEPWAQVRMEEQRDRLNEVIPGWTIVPRMQEEVRVNRIAPWRLAQPADEIRAVPL